MRFYLGTHMPGWLGKTDVPLFVSRRRLAHRKTLPAALGSWALDSGGFTELNMFGRWETSLTQYAEEAARFSENIGRLEWAAVQDWMCEPQVLMKTGLTVRHHQAYTIQSYIDLRGLAPQIPWAPVLQGWAIDDYLDHYEQYQRAGIDLTTLPVVGVGSVCRRQATREVVDLFAALHGFGLSNLHGFGVKTEGLRRSWIALASADSLAWSKRARKRAPLAGCTHQSCANCLRYALAWRRGVIAAASRPCQRAFGW